MNLFRITSLCVCFILSTVYCQDVSPFKGLTVLRAPFVERGPDGKLSGYFVDLLDELARIGKFNYTLQILNIRLYENTPAKLMHELYRNHADFVIADYLFRSSSPYVNFTEPYIISGLSALVRKSELTTRNINTIEELLEWKQTWKHGTKLEEITFGTVSSKNSYWLRLANDRITSRVYERLYESNGLTDSRIEERPEGITRVLKSSYAFIQEAFNNELAMDEHCKLTQLLLRPNSADASKESVQLELAIAVPSGTNGRNNTLGSLNHAISVLKESGRLEQLRQRYWNRKCNPVPSSGIISPYILPITKYSQRILLICRLLWLVFN